MGKTNFRTYKVSGIVIKVAIAILVFLIGLIVVKNNFNGFFYKENRKISEIINELPKKYQIDVDISSNTGTIKGHITKNGNIILVDIKEPIILVGTQIIYDGKSITIKYKDMESRSNSQGMLNNFPVSIVIEIENMVYSSCYNKWYIKDEILNIEGRYNNKDFLCKIDLRQNKIVSISLEDENIFASYQG